MRAPPHVGGAGARRTSAAAVTDPIAATAVQQAKQYKGITLTTIRETGPQAADDKLFGGPRWKALTGINVETLEGAMNDVYTKQVAEHVAKSGKIDVVEALGGWIPDFADRGVIVPIDSYIAKYKAQATIKDIHPAYRSLAKYKGKTYGFFDDGDAWMLYYRKDVFANGKLRAAYRAKYGKSLRVPRSWDEMTEVSQFITDQMAPKIYGQGHGPRARQPRQLLLLHADVPLLRRSVLQPEDDEGDDQRAGGRQDHERDPQGAQGVSAGKREVRLPHDVDDLAPGEDGDALHLAADRPHLRELRAARQGVLVPAQVEDRRQGGLRGGAREERVVQRGRQVRLGGLEEPGRGVPLHAVEHEPVRLPAARHAPLLPA